MYQCRGQGQIQSSLTVLCTWPAVCQYDCTISIVVQACQSSGAILVPNDASHRQINVSVGQQLTVAPLASYTISRIKIVHIIVLIRLEMPQTSDLRTRDVLI